MRIRARITLGTILTVTLTLSGCGSSDKQRTPEEWLSLSYSGLAAMDQYAFNGSMSIKVGGGIEFTPETFEGKVVDHQQLTVQTSSEDPLHWNPVQVLEALNHSNEKVSLANDANDPETVTLQIEEATEVSKQRWEQRLKQQLEQLATNAPSKDSPYRVEWLSELKRSRKQLEAMLASMQVVTDYELVIDEKRMLPLKMDEKTVFSYKQNGQQVSEARYTTVRFQSFDGASSDTVQQTRSRDRMELLASDR